MELHSEKGKGKEKLPSLLFFGFYKEYNLKNDLDMLIKDREA